MNISEQNLQKLAVLIDHYIAVVGQARTHASALKSAYPQSQEAQRWTEVAANMATIGETLGIITPYGAISLKYMDALDNSHDVAHRDVGRKAQLFNDKWCA